MAELALIEAVLKRLGAAGGRVLTGPGDDAAVVRAEGVAVTSIDAVIDGVHFELATHSPGDVGHKALATALSDIAAMGARPGEAYVALALPGGFGQQSALELVDAMAALAERTGTTIAGGDVVSSPVLSATVSVTGWAESPEALVYRGGAAPGELVGVTGRLGGSGEGLRLLRAGQTGGELVDRHRRPEPLLAAGLALAGAGVGAMIDVSDGLATDAAHIARASAVQVELRLEDVPCAPGVDAETAATAGDDYELLFTAAAERRDAVERAARATGTEVTWLGDVRVGGGLVVHGQDGLPVELSGYEHA